MLPLLAPTPTLGAPDAGVRIMVEGDGEDERDVTAVMECRGGREAVVDGGPASLRAS